MPNIMKAFLKETVLKVVSIMNNTCGERNNVQKERQREPKNEQEKLEGRVKKTLHIYAPPEGDGIPWAVFKSEQV